MRTWHYFCKEDVDNNCPFIPGKRYIVRESTGEHSTTCMSIDGVFIEHEKNNRRTIRNVPKEVCSKYLTFIKKIC